MKLQLSLASLLLLAINILAQAQPSKQTNVSAAYSHAAHFNVFDYTTKAPIERAVISNQSGMQLGYTNRKGELSVSLPPNTVEFYTIQAEGFNPMNIRLTQADKKKGEYEIFLPAMEVGYSRATASSLEPTMDELYPGMVKVYVKQDPATYQKKSMQGGEISFSVQVAASSNPISEMNAQKEWQDLGQVYVQKENGMYKVRIGPYETQLEAKQVLLGVKSKGRNDAFIVVHQVGNHDTPISKAQTTQVTQTPIVVASQPDLAEGDYKIRVASYLQPGAFNPDGIDQLGRLESYRKGEWTIMMIGGFRTIEEARRARNIVLSKGFSDAAIVKDNDGILETIEEN